MREVSPLRVLFFVDRPGVVRQYACLVSELAERGHTVHLAFDRPPEGGRAQQLEALAAGRNVTFGLAPARGSFDGWRSVALLARAIADLAHHAHPRYERATVLRKRMVEQVLKLLAKRRQFEPIGRWLVLRLTRRLASSADGELAARVIRWAARLEAAIPTSPAIDRYLREQAPDVVLATPVVKFASRQVEFLKSARRLGIPTGVCVASWDNLTNKGLLKVVPDRVFVWNEVQRQEAVELHGMPAERVIATGAQLFDEWFERRPSRRRPAFVRSVGLDPEEPYVLFVGSSPFVTQHSDEEVRFVTRWLGALRSSGDEQLRRLGVIVRPHPIGKQWREVDLSSFGRAVVWPERPERPVSVQARDDFFDSLVHSAAVVGINTTAMIEAAIAGKSVLTVLAPEFAQESTLHFHYLLTENGGFLHVADSLDHHLVQLRRVLGEGAADAQRRRAFVESFVRPRGLSQAATPILASSIEELAGLPVDPPPTPSLLRLPLTLEAGFCSLALHSSSVESRVHRLRRRIVGKARRLGLLQPRPEG